MSDSGDSSEAGNAAAFGCWSTEIEPDCPIDLDLYSCTTLDEFWI